MRHPVRTGQCAALVLAGCAGGDRAADMAGSGGAAGYRAAPALARRWGPDRIGADQAYAGLAIRHGGVVRPGSGVTGGILDTGTDEDRPAFARTRIDEIFEPGAPNETGVLPSHGTAVAGVIAAGRESALPDRARGVAPGADLAVFAFGTGTGTGSPPEPDSDLPAEDFAEWSDIVEASDDDNAAEFRTVPEWRDGGRRVDFLDLSFGSFAIVDGYTEKELRNAHDRAIATIAQEGVEEKTISVWAAGNTNGLWRPSRNRRWAEPGREPGTSRNRAAAVPVIRPLQAAGMLSTLPPNEARAGGALIPPRPRGRFRTWGRPGNPRALPSQGS